MCVRCRESWPEAGDRRHRARPRRGAGNGLNQVLARVEAVSLVAAEEEHTVLGDRSADRAAELIQLERRFRHRRSAARGGNDTAVRIALRIEVVGRVEAVAPEVFEDGPVEVVAARLGDHADLPARAGTELGRIAAGFDPELLDVLEARL